ncbi:hypothetical protein P2318_07850 [Myxococcaceae bacterium GXIMD 01537]
MFRRVMAAVCIASALGLGCGGAEVSSGEEQESAQDTAALATTCEALQGKTCSPDTDRGCLYSNGTPGECFCQAIPFNKWVCIPAT